MKNLLLFTLLSLPVLGLSQSKSSIEFFVAPDYIYRFTQSKLDERISNFFEQRADSTEKGKISMQFGIDYYYSFESQFGFKSGLHLLSYGINNINNGKEFIVQSGIFNANTPSQQPIFSKFSSKTLSYFIDVPICFRYYFLESKLRLYLEAGFVGTAYLTSWERTETFFDKTSELKRIEFIKNFGVATLFSLGTEYQIHNNWSFFARPNFRFRLNSFSNNTFFNTYTYNLSLQIGARHIF